MILSFVAKIGYRIKIQYLEITLTLKLGTELSVLLPSFTRVGMSAFGQ